MRFASMLYSFCSAGISSSTRRPGSDGSFGRVCDGAPQSTSDDFLPLGHSGATSKQGHFLRFSSLANPTRGSALVGDVRRLPAGERDGGLAVLLPREVRADGEVVGADVVPGRGVIRVAFRQERLGAGYVGGRAEELPDLRRRLADDHPLELGTLVV